MREGEIEVASLGEFPQRTQPPGHGGCLVHRACSPVLGAYDLVGDVVQLEQLDRLRVLACGHVDMVAALPKELDERSEERHLRRVGDVDPDAHAVTLASQR